LVGYFIDILFLYFLVAQDLELIGEGVVVGRDYFVFVGGDVFGVVEREAVEFE